MCQEPVEGREQATCVQRAIQESRASYLGAKSWLRVARKQVVCLAQATCVQRAILESRASYLCAEILLWSR